VVLGVSKDGAESHKKFTAKYKLPFVLLSDPNLEVMKKYGAYGKKMMSDMDVKIKELEAQMSRDASAAKADTQRGLNEMKEKRALYFEAGAEEVWFCRRDGRMEFFRTSA